MEVSEKLSVEGGKEARAKNTKIEDLDKESTEVKAITHTNKDNDNEAVINEMKAVGNDCTVTKAVINTFKHVGAGAYNNKDVGNVRNDVESSINECKETEGDNINIKLKVVSNERSKDEEAVINEGNYCANKNKKVEIKASECKEVEKGADESNVKEEKSIANDSKTFCESCQIDFKETPAIGICQECEEYMCFVCFSCHKKAKPCRNHDLIKGASPEKMNAIKESPEKCRRHNNETIKFYCRRHESVGCGDCMIISHKLCEREYINDLSEKLDQSELPKFTAKFEQLHASTIKVSEQIKLDQKECGEMRSALLSKIISFRTDINAYLDKEEAELVTQANQLVDSNEEELTKLKEECDAISTSITRMKKMLKSQGNSNFVIAYLNAPKTIQSFEEQLRLMQPNKRVNDVRFVPGEEISDFVKSRKKFGICSQSLGSEKRWAMKTERTGQFGHSKIPGLISYEHQHRRREMYPSPRRSEWWPR